VLEDARPPLDVAALRAGLTAPWTRLDVVESTESTNADLLGRPAGSVLAAEYQRSGRGRLDRSWTSPPRAGLTFSAVVAARQPAPRLGWLSLLTGVALCDAIGSATGIGVALKWPNDLLAAAGGGKLAGILVQVVDGTAVIGVGLNVSATRAELPVSTASSLALEASGPIDRTAVLSAILAALGARYLQWAGVDGDAEACGLADDYRARCATIGQDVLISRTNGAQRANAVGIDADGQLRLRADGIEQSVAAGDIVHLRPSGPSVR
jgi:BirA family biotin operon repressor/biotin-[acetyl-CoA-carboxylase] ligase